MPAHTLPHQIVALIQHVQLNEAGWWAKSIDQMLKAALWMHGSPVQKDQLPVLAKDCIGVTISQQDIDAALARLGSSTDVFVLDDGRLKLAQHAADAISHQVGKVEADEQAASRVFASALSNSGWSGDGNGLWTTFRDKVLRPIIRDLGARTYELVEHQRQNIADLEIAKQFLQQLPKVERPQVQVAMQQFMLSQSAEVRRFLLAQMTASFCAASCQLGKDDLDALTRRSGRTVEFVLFLDTNFLYSLLQVHDIRECGADDLAALRWAVLFCIVKLMQRRHDAVTNSHKLPAEVLRHVEGDRLLLEKPVEVDDLYLLLFPIPKTPLVLPYHNRDPKKKGVWQSEMVRMKVKLKDLLKGRGLRPGERRMLRWYAESIGYSWRDDDDRDQGRLVLGVDETVEQEEEAT